MKIKQRGSAWSIKLVFFLYKFFGYKFIYALMYPVSYFYYLKAKNVKEALHIYYKQIGKEFTPRVHHEHLCHFAICLCDRFISLINPEDYTFEIQKETELEKDLQKGGILLLSHFGGWACAANCFSYLDLKMHIVMQESLMQGIKDIEESLKIKSNANVSIIDIQKGGIAVTLDIANALSANELIAMMADRATNIKNQKEIDFFKKGGFFNKNPFEIAYKTNKPLIALFISFEKPQRYKIDYIKIPMDIKNSMNEEVEKCMSIYAKKFENIIENHPYGWFNFYDFWGNES